MLKCFSCLEIDAVDEPLTRDSYVLSYKNSNFLIQPRSFLYAGKSILRSKYDNMTIFKSLKN